MAMGTIRQMTRSSETKRGAGGDGPAVGAARARPPCGGPASFGCAATAGRPRPPLGAELPLGGAELPRVGGDHDLALRRAARELGEATEESAKLGHLDRARSVPANQVGALERGISFL